MVGLIQRVLSAKVVVDQQEVAAIGKGLLVFVGIARGDDADTGHALLQRIIALRLFAQDDGRMGRSLAQAEGDILLVPQFTLTAHINGNRPDFGPAAPAGEARALFTAMVVTAQKLLPHGTVASGVFGAHMAVHLVNDGPVTFHLHEPPRQITVQHPSD